MTGRIEECDLLPFPGGPSCLVCNRPRADFPMCFQDGPRCSVNCEKRWQTEVMSAHRA